ncbi:hypothetical protein C8J57DRAFT_1705300 [Mycena rebaudengoi]|nr:hypothetical protein C8J57DRAFT_1705300 [Mycena rebaudengoi]
MRLPVARTSVRLPVARTPTRLPPELSDRIIDFLHDDGIALAQTALVCRQWLARSRLHHFASVDIHGGNCLALIALLQSSVSDSNNPNTISPHIKTVHVSEHVARLPAIPSAQYVSLDFRRAQHPYAQDISARTLCGAFPRLVHLRLDSVFGDTREMVGRVLSALSCLERLDVVRMRDTATSNNNYGTDDDVPYAGAALPRLKALMWGEERAAHVVRSGLFAWLATQRPLEALDLRVGFPACAGAVTALLRASAPALVSLALLVVSLDMPSTRTNPAEELGGGVLDFSGCTQLQDLALGTTYRDINSALFPLLPSILSNIGSSELRRLKITLPLSPFRNDENALQDEPRDTVMRQIDEVLSSEPKFGRLEVVELVVGGIRYFSVGGVSSQEDMMEASVRKRLPKCESRGILSVKFSAA